MQVLPGDMGFFKGDTTYSKLIGFFDGYYSHTWIGFFPDVLRKKDRIFEANIAIMTTDAELTVDSDSPQEIWRFTNIDWQAMNAALEESYREANGQAYAFLMIPWFVYKWIMVKVFRVNMNKAKQWVPKNKFCSQLVYRVINRYLQYANGTLTILAMRMIMEDYAADATGPEALREIVNRFSLVGGATLSSSKK